MCGGGGAEKQRPGASEIALARQAGLREQEFEEQFFPLEVFEIEQFRDPKIQRINTSLLAGRENADVARNEKLAREGIRQEAQAGGVGLASGEAVSRLQKVGEDVALSTGLAKTSASRGAQAIHDSEGLGIIRTGQDTNRLSDTGLSSLARNENFKSGERLRARQLESESRSQALGSIAAAGISGIGKNFLQASDGTVGDADLSPGARYTRNKIQGRTTVGGPGSTGSFSPGNRPPSSSGFYKYGGG